MTKTEMDNLNVELGKRHGVYVAAERKFQKCPQDAAAKASAQMAFTALNAVVDTARSLGVAVSYRESDGCPYVAEDGSGRAHTFSLDAATFKICRNHYKRGVLYWGKGTEASNIGDREAESQSFYRALLAFYDVLMCMGANVAFEAEEKKK